MYLWIFTSLWKISKLHPPEIASGLSISILVLEFAKLRAFCAYMPYAPTCQCALRAYAPYVPQITTCLRAYIPSFFTCLRAYMRIHIFPAYVPLCLNYFVPTCAHFSRAYVPTTTHKIYLGSLLYLVLLFFSELFDLSFHSKPQNKFLLLKLHTPILSWGGFFYLVQCIRRNNNLRTH